MKITARTLIIVAISTLIGGILLGGLFFGGSGDSSPEVHDHAKVGETWTCSMHPQIRSGEPGSCPICRMELIPLGAAADDSEAMTISMSPAAMKLGNVSTAIVGKTSPVKSLRLNGKVQQDERQVFSQATHLPGRIEKLMVNFTGEYVRKGQLIAYVHSMELAASTDELFEAIKMKDTQPALYQAAREKLKHWKLTDRQIDGIIRGGKAVDTFPIYAEISGYVTEKYVNLGDYIERGQAIYEIANLSDIWVLFDIYESDMTWVNTGDTISFTVSSLPGQQYEGTIDYIDPVIDSRTRVAKARMEIKNDALLLKPEMFVTGVLESHMPIESDVVIVPKTAVMWTGERSVVYVKETTAQRTGFVMREVLLGPALGKGYIIKEGLQQGEEIAINGTFSIDAAAQLEGKPSMMNPDGGQATNNHNHGKKGGMQAIPNGERSSIKPPNRAIREALNPLFGSYLRMKDALVDDDLKTAHLSAEQFGNDLALIDMTLFDGEAHTAWITFHSRAEGAVQRAEASSDIEGIRVEFQPLSDAMIQLVRIFRPLDEEIYVQHCPMADNNAGADWLSLSSDVKNPYFGASMLTCGEVVEELK